MKEYIDKDATRDLMEQALVDEWEIQYADDRLDDIPAADVVEVVRCRDCHWAHPILGEADITCDIDCLSHYNDDYCSYGQRKDGGVSDGKA